MTQRNPRNRVGLPSPPEHYNLDSMTLGPVLPAGWNGDAWSIETDAETGYALRAWNKATGVYAISKASTYEAARKLLLEEIESGGSGKVEIQSEIFG